MVRYHLDKFYLQGYLTLRAAFGTSFVFKNTDRCKMGDLTYDETSSRARAAFIASVSAVKPSQLVKNNVQFRDKTLTVKGKEFQIKQPCHVVGFGKAVLEMALAIEEILGESMQLSIVSVPFGTLQKNSMPLGSRIKVLEGAQNNLPDKMAEQNASEILNIVRTLESDDTLLVLVSGGGSALLPLPQSPVTLEEKLQVIKHLASAGADIFQLNCVRKRLSSVKGGRLASAAQPATVISLILSDVIGDPIDVIASGPTSVDLNPERAAWDVICHFGLQTAVPQSVQVCLSSTETMPLKLQEDKIHNIVIGNNTVAINAALQKMIEEGYSTCALSGSIEGNVVRVAKFYSQLAYQICEALSNRHSEPLLKLDSDQTYFSGSKESLMKAISESHSKRGVCLIAGGETTVTVTGTGKGGRNQELALRFAEESQIISEKFEFMKQFKILLLSAGTDGIDGPTNAAGAFGYSEQIGDQSYKTYLEENDSHTFYAKLHGGKDLLVTGHTGTNVMDIHILTIEFRRRV